MTTFFTPAQILSAFQYRKSCRHYDPDRKISAEDFNYILELARLSPSSVGSEPWQFLVVQNPELRQKLKPFAWGMAATLDTASHIVVILAKKNARYDSPLYAGRHPAPRHHPPRSHRQNPRQIPQLPSRRCPPA